MCCFCVFHIHGACLEIQEFFVSICFVSHFVSNCGTAEGTTLSRESVTAAPTRTEECSVAHVQGDILEHEAVAGTPRLHAQPETRHVAKAPEKWAQPEGA